MRILHTADWHLGKIFEHSQVNFSLLDEHKTILERIVSLADEENVDVVVIAGDIFDSYNPSNEARRLFNETIRELSKNGERAVIIISGNHDSPEGLAAIRPLAANLGIFINHLPGNNTKESFQNSNFAAELRGNWLKIELAGGDSAAFYLLPYVSESRLNEVFTGDTLFDKTLSYNEKIEKILKETSPFDTQHRILVSHIFVDKGTEAGSEKKLILGSSYLFESSRIPEEFDLVLLGHLHRSQQIDERIFYSGSIFPMNLQEIESSPAKFVHIYDLKDRDFGHHEVKILNEDYVRVYEFGKIEDALEQAEILNKSLVYLKIKTPLTNPSLMVELRKMLRGHLLGVTFEMPEELETDFFESTDFESLSDEELFRHFYKSQKGEEPDEEIVRTFIEVLNEVKNETH